jgi:hypothetical protein
MPTIEFDITGDEQPDSVQLIELVRSDTDETPAGVVLPLDFETNDAGHWSVVFAAPAPGLHYDFVRRLTFADTSFNDIPGSFDDDTSDPSCRYFIYSDLANRFGLKNIAEASQRDEEVDDPNLNVVQQAMTYACDQVDRALVTYATPLEFSDTVVPQTVKEWAMVICMENMFNARGDTDKNTNIYKRLVDDVYKEMALYNMPGTGRVLSTATRTVSVWVQE